MNGKVEHLQKIWLARVRYIRAESPKREALTSPEVASVTGLFILHSPSIQHKNLRHKVLRACRPTNPSASRRVQATGTHLHIKPTP